MSPVELSILLGVLGTLLLLLIVFAAWAVGIYNKLVRLKNGYENGYSQIDVQLMRRYDLIPNLVETVKGYMKHESETLEAVVQARNQAYSAGKAAAQNPGDKGVMGQLGKAEGQLGAALGRLLMVAESYPDLKSNQNMLALQEELTATENKVSFARQGYNDSVTNFNTVREQFPALMFANMFGFGEAELLEIENEKQREVPQVKF